MAAAGFPTLARAAVQREPVPLEILPQFYNWGAGEIVKKRAIQQHGYVTVTNIVAASTEYIPASAVMFRYSGTDGFASGNSLAEATLYAIYELIERDTGQIHLQDPTCRKSLPQFKLDQSLVTDPRCHKLIAQADDKGCDMILFALPNIYDLPCVMCHVYDRNRRIHSIFGPS